MADDPAMLLFYLASQSTYCMLNELKTFPSDHGAMPKSHPVACGSEGFQE
jgi:hypothetical protein